MSVSIDFSDPVIQADPYSVYAHGEEVLRERLTALRDWQLRRVVETYGLAGASEHARVYALSGRALVELIVSGIRARVAAADPTHPTI